jgi:hypothetical protein
MKHFFAALFGALLLGVAPAHDGAHDFDFQIGMWNVDISKLVHNSDGTKTWIKLHGTHGVQALWGGRANIGVLEIDGPQGHFEGMQLRLYNPHTHQWALSFASSRSGVLGAPSIGGFAGGHGEFLDTETENGHTVLSRSITRDITARSYTDEAAASSDGGKTWEVNWIAHYTKAKGL